jgi:hypothetical protein
MLPQQGKWSPTNPKCQRGPPLLTFRVGEPLSCRGNNQWEVRLLDDWAWRAYSRSEARKKATIRGAFDAILMVI